MSHLLDFLIKPAADNIGIGSAMDLGSIGDIDDIQFNSMNSELLSSDFFENVMSMESNNLGLLAGDPDSSLTDGSYFDYLNQETQSFGDALSVTDGLSHSDALSHSDGLLSPGGLSIDGDGYNTGSEITLNPLDKLGNYITIKEEFEDDHKQLPNIQQATITISAEDLNANNGIYTILKQEPSPILTTQDVTQNTSPTKVILRQGNTKKIIMANKPVINQGPRNRKQVLRVQSLNGNGKSVLLPLNVKNLKKIRIVNTTDMKLDNIKTNVTQSVLKKSPPSEIYALSSSESIDDEIESEPTNNRYPPLNLTAEEKRLLLKEGITLPTHYPLTKNEEKDLKRIRRKIRNKISAQDSRKRKKEYVDKLEEKAKRTTEENEFLRKKIKLLHKQNSKLMDQMRKLQAVLFNTSSSRATPTTCLMIVLFSTLLVCLPNLNLSDKTDVGEQQLVAARRALLFKQGVNEDDVNMDDFLVFNKDEEPEVESHEDELIENENNTENIFGKFLEDLTKKFEHRPDEKNCFQKNGEQGGLFEFCNKYEDDIKGVIENMKELFEKNGTFEQAEPPPSRKFIEPDISDDEDGILVKSGQKRKLSDLNDDRLVKRGKVISEEIHPNVGPMI